MLCVTWYRVLIETSDITWPYGVLGIFWITLNRSYFKTIVKLHENHVTCHFAWCQHK